MNERVWLQSKVTFVNTKLAISLGFLATFLTFSCSPAENKEEPAQIQPVSEVIEEKTPLPFLPIIWESKPASGEIIDLAIGKSVNGSFYITAILNDGSAETFDIDGIPVARSKEGLFSEISTGVPIEVSGANLLAHVTKSTDGHLSLALASPENQIVGFAALPKITDNSSFDILCPGLSEFADDQIHGSYIRDAVTYNFTVDISSDSPSYDERTAEKVPELKSLCTSTSALLNHESNAQDAFAWLNVNADNLIKATNTKLGREKTFTLREGMSVSAPTQISSIATYTGFISIDYPKGLVAIAGKHSDNIHKISFVSAASIIENFSDDLDEESSASEVNIEALQEALRNAQEN
ncbi:hypothetical protein [Hirschia maritima]|uniref:hypothetical protein n=1 Tax=Hirschia maritima TaxID=1121961 RepID=UPI0003660C47|nr:hypothetical protein [Hirschia maritima]